MITDDDVEKAIDWLRDSAGKASKAKAEKIYLEEYRKVVKAGLQRERPMETLGAQEAYAYAEQRYKEHLEIMRDAVERDEYYHWMRVAAEAKIEAWRSQESTRRAEGRATS